MVLDDGIGENPLVKILILQKKFEYLSLIVLPVDAGVLSIKVCLHKKGENVMSGSLPWATRVMTTFTISSEMECSELPRFHPLK